MIGSYQLGLVDGSFAEHAAYQGRLCIPYLSKLGGVTSLKFRVPHDCVPECQHQKYLTPYPTRLYNPLAFERAEQLGYIGICEGEFDAMILDHYCGIPAVAVPGVETWVKHPEWRVLFDGYSRVLFFGDDDEAGRKLEARVLHEIPEARAVALAHKDVNQAYLAEGPEFIRKAAGLLCP